MTACKTHGDNIAMCPECDSGTWIIVSGSGSTYLIDLDAMTQTRFPYRERLEEWLASGGARVPVERLGPGVVNDTPGLRRDSEEIRIVEVGPARLGYYLDMVLDLVGDGETLTTRSTNVVVTVERVEMPM